MNLPDQVLSINQVQELTELGFDVKKYASMYYTPNWITKFGVYEIQDYLLQIGGLGEDYDGDCIPTLTIGDIINILPKMIGVYSIEFDFIGNQVYIDYIYRRESLLKLDHIFYMDNKESAMSNLMNALFNTLKWCIVKKRISKNS